MNYLSNQYVKDVKSTLGVKVQTINFSGITLNVYDLGGKKSYKEILAILLRKYWWLNICYRCK